LSTAFKTSRRVPGSNEFCDTSLPTAGDIGERRVRHFGGKVLKSGNVEKKLP
jgi:hypothetical protein